MDNKPLETPDLRERGGTKDGKPQFLDRRLYMQLSVFGGCSRIDGVVKALEQTDVVGVLYEDMNDPRGIGLLAIHEDPNYFVTTLRKVLQQEVFASLAHHRAFTMLGRTYSVGYEPDLEQWLLHKPRRTALTPDTPWAIWYPLRRSGAFANLPGDQQRKILAEHGSIGQSFGRAGLVHDIRLSCHGLDTNDNDFVIGLVGHDLHPLSAVVQAMRRTTQTSQYLDRLGPFFIGRAAWQSRMIDV